MIRFSPGGGLSGSWCASCRARSPRSAQLALRPDMPHAAAGHADRGVACAGRAAAASSRTIGASRWPARSSRRLVRRRCSRCPIATAASCSATLPPGPYLVRAHLQGYVPARGRDAAGQPPARARRRRSSLTRRRDRPKPPAVLAAGVGTAGESPSRRPTTATHEHDEVAWRLRHLSAACSRTPSRPIAELDDDDSFLERLAAPASAARSAVRRGWRRRCLPTCRSTARSTC